MGYPIRKWNDVLSIISGKNQKVVADSSGQYPIYGSGGIMGYANNYLCEAGTTIIGRKGTINRPIFVNERFWNVDTAFGVFPGEMLHPKFLFYFCQSFNFKALDKSTTIPSLAKRDLLNIEMPVPSFPEQEHIISRIEELFSQLDASVAELKTAKERLKVYRQAVLKEAFAKFHAFTSLKQASERIFDGPFGSNLKTADYVEQGVRVVRLENVKNAWFDNAKRSFVTREKYQTISSHTVYPDDLIMSTFIIEFVNRIIENATGAFEFGNTLPMLFYTSLFIFCIEHITNNYRNIKAICIAGCGVLIPFLFYALNVILPRYGFGEIWYNISLFFPSPFKVD